MSVKRPLKINSRYLITEASGFLEPSAILGNSCRVMLQLADDSLPGQMLAAEVIMLTGPKTGERLLLQGVRLRLYQEKASCGCAAYSFPHRRFSGHCYASLDGPFCGECRKPCEVYIRSAEPEEKKSLMSSKYRYFSKCCNGIPYEDPELQIQHSEE